MQWLNNAVDELLAKYPSGDIIVSSGVSPSGTYHLGTLREVLTAEAVAREVRRRGRTAQHLHIVDDLDIFRKVPADVDPSFEQYLGMPLADVPSPDPSKAASYADYFLNDLLVAAPSLHIDFEAVRMHKRYREGFMVPVIETALEHVDDIKRVLKEVSGRELDENWTPVQVVDDGFLKNRKFVSIDTATKTVTYESGDTQKTADYSAGEVKLAWRIDWPARWSLLHVMAEPFGRDHATKGGSYDTGKLIVRDVFNGEAPYPLPYNFINRVGETKKMSKSKGDVVTAAQLLAVMPSELVWYFILRYSPDKLLFFGEGETLLRLFDEFAELLAKPNKTADEQQLVDLCLTGVDAPTVSNIPFSHLVESYQAALRDADKALEIISRTEHAATAGSQADTIKRELAFIGNWLDQSAPDELKFELSNTPVELSEQEKAFLQGLADKVAEAPADADGEWFHEAIYQFKTDDFGPKQLFQALYKQLINKTSGPRAGWFLSLLPRGWLVERLRQAK